jgi:membrane protein YqaA with SNARE-associated domain
LTSLAFPCSLYAEVGMIENGGVDVNLTVEEGAAPAKNHSWIRRHWVSVITISAVLVLSATIYFSGGLSGDFAAYGYLGVFLISILGSAVILVPVPSMPVVFIMGAILNPWLVGLMAGLGEPIGEIACYMAGYSGRVSMENRRFYAKLKDWMMRRGSLVLFLFACIPNPTFDLAGAAAGALRYPFWKYLLVLFLGKTAKGLFIAFAGYWTLRLIVQLLVG